jgi:hypothetical protein
VSQQASAAIEADGPAPRLHDGLRDCIGIFLAVRLGLWLLSIIAVTLIEPRTGLPIVPGWATHPLQAGWTAMFTATERQDALWFLRIATQGYSTADASAAFFPLYPMAIRVISFLPGIGPLGAALLVSNGACFGSLLLLHGLTRLEISRGGFGRGRDADLGSQDGGATLARRTVMLLAIFPTAFFLLAPYSESLFLLCVLAAFWFSRRDRWLLVALFAALAAATRSIGVVLVPALAFEAIDRWRARGGSLVLRLAAAAATLLGPMLYLAYWQLRLGDAGAPIDAQRDWGRSLTFPVMTFIEACRTAIELGTWWLIDLLVVGVVTAAIIAGYRLLRPSYLTYAALSLLVPLSFPATVRPLLSMPRFVLVCFPAMWVIAIAVERRRIPEPLVVGVFAGSYVLLASLFVNWWHIF